MYSDAHVNTHTYMYVCKGVHIRTHTHTRHACVEPGGDVLVLVLSLARMADSPQAAEGGREKQESDNKRKTTAKNQKQTSNSCGIHKGRRFK